MSRSLGKVLVTGGAGFIGSHIVDALLARGTEVGVLDDFSTGNEVNLAQHTDSSSGRSPLKLHKGDTRDWDFVRDAVKGYDAILHQAALVSVGRSVEDPLRTNSVNVNGTLNILIAARDAGVHRVVYASSSSVYGETKSLPKTEALETHPISPYAVSKLAAENYCRVFARVYGMETVSLRYFNVYGPRQRYGHYSGVIPIFVGRIMKGERPMIFGDGLQTRDFTYVKDVVAANLLALERDIEPGDFFNISAGSQTTLNELALSIERLMGKPDLGVEHAPPRPGDVRFSFSSITKAKEKLGYSPKFSLQEGLRNVVEWFASAGLPRSEL